VIVLQDRALGEANFLCTRGLGDDARSSFAIANDKIALPTIDS
jgi:hypothetical protein